MWFLSLPVEILIGFLIGLIPGLVEMNWEIHGLLVLFAIGLTIHIAKRLEIKFLARAILVAIVLGILIFGSYHSIWVSFHEDFPTVTGESALSRIIELCSLAVCGFSGYVFLIRPRGKEGYRVLPAQVMAWGACMVAAGFVTLAIGLGWQFKQNWAAGITPTGAPVFSLVPPQITQATPPRALPAPQQQAPQTPFFSDYNLTDAGVKALADELFKARDALGKRIELDRMSTDGSGSAFVGNFGRACDEAGIECPVSNVHPNSPDERGLMIYVTDPNKPPAAAEELRSVLLKLGIDVPFVARAGFGPPTFTLFVGPKPQTN